MDILASLTKHVLMQEPLLEASTYQGVHSQGKVLDLVANYSEFTENFGEEWRSQAERRDALVKSIQEDKDDNMEP